jgi:Tol biopolymer transport system component
MTARTGNGLHLRFRELAATALDFPLSAAEAAELEAHLATCPACARLAGSLRFDASYRLDSAIGAAIAGRPPRPSPGRTLVLVAATALLLVALLGAAAVGAFLWRTLQPPLVVVDPSPKPPAFVVDPSPVPSGEPGPAVPALAWELGQIPPMVEGGESAPAAVAGGDAGFVAVGRRVFRDNATPSGGTASAWHSNDGLAWVPATAEDGLALGNDIPMDDEPMPGFGDVAWGPAGFVAVGIDLANGSSDRVGAAWHSGDGVAWTRVELPEASRVRPAVVAWTGSAYVMVGVVREDGAPRAAAWRSPDGRTWERVPDSDAFDIGGYIQFYSAAGTGGLADVTTATDGSLIAVGHACTGTTSPEDQATCRPIALRSADGESWSSVPGPDVAGVGLASVAANGTRFVAIPGGPGALRFVQAPGQVVPQGGTTQVAIGDETAWRLVDLPGVPRLERIVALGDWFVAVSTAGNRITLWSSLDGEAWTEMPGIPQPPTAADQDPEMQAFSDVDLAVAGLRVVIAGRNEADPVGATAFSLVGTAEQPEPSPSPTPAVLPTDSLLLAVAGDEVIVTITPDGETYEALAGGDAADWSPDGRQIVYACRPSVARDEPPATNICVMNADGTGQRRVVEGGFAPSWSPDGAQIMFSRSVIDAGDTWVANADGSGARMVGAGTGSWSPDGSRILLVGASGAAPDATVVRPDGSGARQLGDCRGAAWSPDGRRLACTRWDEPRGTLYTIDVATGTTSTILESDVAIGDPAWVSSEPELLAITMARPGADPSALQPGNDLYLFRPGVDKPVRLTNGLSIEGPINVSPDGAWLAFTAVGGETRNVHVVSTAGDERQVTGNGATGAPSWQPESDRGSTPPPPATRPVADWLPAPSEIPLSGGDFASTAAHSDAVFVLLTRAGDAMAGRNSRSVLALLDARGTPRSGWPIAVDGWYCANPNGPAWPPETTADGSVTVMCLSDETTEGTIWTGAFRFDAAGRQIGSWTYGAPTWSYRPRVVDGQLVLIGSESGDGEPSAGAYWLVSVAPDGTVRTGSRYEVAERASDGLVEIGPDGTAYRTTQGAITAFDMAGVRADWQVSVDGVLSKLAFGPDGRVYLTMTDGMHYPGTEIQPSRDPATSLLVLDGDGQSKTTRSPELPVAGALAWSGAGPDGVPIPPLVAPDGSVFVLGETDGRAVVYRLDQSGRVMSGWPYRAAADLAWRGDCPADSTGCGVWRVTPAAGPGPVIYLLLADPGATTGTFVPQAVGVDPDGTLVEGWLLGLDDGARWSVAVGSDGIVYVLTANPAEVGGMSATLHVVAPDGTLGSETDLVIP